MMLRKRQRPPIKRTTSMTEFILDTTAVQSATTAGRNHRRNSVDITDSTHFLRSCSLCNRRLIPGRDIFMYRGDSGFCSLECREEQIIEDERKEKRSLLEKEATATATATDGGACISDQVVVSNNAEAVAAVVM